jgi:signal transduction histidine kinase
MWFHISAECELNWNIVSIYPATFVLMTRLAKLARVLRTPLLVGWLFVGVGGSSRADYQQKPASAVAASTLTNAAQVLTLSPVQASAGLPFKTRGLVTYCEPSVLFVQDESAGIFIYQTKPSLDFLAGQYVEVTGVTSAGQYSPIIASPEFQLLEKGPRVTPRCTGISEIEFGGLDAQWVECTGVVRKREAFRDRLLIQLTEPPRSIKVWIRDPQAAARAPDVGSYVKVQGVVGTSLSPGGQIQGFQIFVSGLTNLTVLRPTPADPFSEPACTIRDLRGYHSRVGPPGRAKTQGTVTLTWPGGPFFLQDSDAGLEVHPDSAPGDLIPGDVVEVVGFLGPAVGPPVMEGAQVRKLSTQPAPEPTKIPSADLFSDRYDRRLIQVAGEFLGLSKASSNTVQLAMESDERMFRILIPASRTPENLRSIQPASRLRVTGVRLRADYPGNLESTICTLLGSEGGVEVVSAPISTPPNKLVLLSALAALLTCGLLLALWRGRQLQAQAGQMLQAQQTLKSDLRHSERQLHRALQERERIGRDLHDDIIQSIYGLGLNVEDCRRVLRESPQQADKRLAAVVELLNTTIRSVRGFLAGLEPKVLSGSELKVALKSLALTGSDSPTQFQLEVDPSAANGLSSTQATQLLRIAKEAISNSQRHSRASTLTVSLHSTGDGVRLEICDNGVGFEPETLETPGHGLRNMAARAREIEADFRIVSAVGKGCRILVTTTRPHFNEHGPNKAHFVTDRR